jgi:hypothetical protein
LHFLKHAQRRSLTLTNMLSKNVEFVQRDSILFFGFGKTTYHKYKVLYEKDVRLGFHRNQGQQKPKESIMVAWLCLQILLDNLDEPMPHLFCNGGRGTSDIIYRLLAAMTKMQVYNKMKIMMKLENCDLISQPKFCVIWNKSFDNYKISQVKCFLQI